MTELTEIAVPVEVADWYKRFFQHSWSGSLLIHFNCGKASSIEPKPNVRVVPSK